MSSIPKAKTKYKNPINDSGISTSANNSPDGNAAKPRSGGDFRQNLENMRSRNGKMILPPDCQQDQQRQPLHAAKPKSPGDRPRANDRIGRSADPRQPTKPQQQRPPRTSASERLGRASAPMMFGEKLQEPASLGQEPMECDDLDEKECICLRPLKRIVCRGCGYYIVGRVQKHCEAHPMETYVMDITCCPQCKACPIYLYEALDSKKPA